MPSNGAGCDVAIVWFRKCLRVHDNAALVEASKVSTCVCPIFVIDPHFGPSTVGVRRFNFLLESLRDLDAQLRKLYKSRLLVLRGQAEKVLGELLRTGKPLVTGKPKLVLWERDTEPFALKRDAAVTKLAEASGVEVRTFSGHTLYDVEEALARNKGKAPTQMPGMVTLAKALGEPPQPLPPPARVPLPPKDVLSHADQKFAIPTLKEMGYKEPEEDCGIPGGETAGLARLTAKLKESAYICGFVKSQTRSTAFDPPSTTVLSPYIKFGCVSVRRFYHGLKKVETGKKHSLPPGSLVGQLYFREIAYLQGISVPNFDRQVGNPCCKPIPWGKDVKFILAWEKGQTGYPFIDAAMRQLARVGWLHHLARHAVACFLTRGDLWQSWERGRDVFDKLLLDADWAINNMNWLALSGAAPWSPPFFRVYHPVPKMDSSLNVQDPDGKYVREFVPELRRMPSKYIYAPWTAPLDVQREAGCVVGKDYPRPIVEHEKASRANLAAFKKALSAAKKQAPAAAGAAAPAGANKRRGGGGRAAPAAKRARR